jgi:hypothetical protein
MLHINHIIQTTLITNLKKILQKKTNLKKNNLKQSYMIQVCSTSASWIHGHLGYFIYVLHLSSNEFEKCINTWNSITKTNVDCIYNRYSYIFMKIIIEKNWLLDHETQTRSCLKAENKVLTPNEGNITK